MHHQDANRNAGETSPKLFPRSKPQHISIPTFDLSQANAVTDIKLTDRNAYRSGASSLIGIV